MLIKSNITLILCLSIIIGILFGHNFFDIPQIISIIFLFLFLLSFAANSKLAYFYAVLIGLIIGIYRINSYTNSEKNNNIQSLIKDQNQVELTGIIGKIPDCRNNKQKIVLSSIEHLNKKYNGNIIITTNSFPRYQVGQKIIIKGKLSIPENFDSEFNYIGYLGINKIYAESNYPDLKVYGREKSYQTFLFDLRQKFIDQTKKFIPPDLSGLLTGIIVGDKNNISQKAAQQFRTSGLTHIIVVSGYNLTIFAVIFNKLLSRRLPKIFNYLITNIFMLSFVILTGAEASIVRAYIMTNILLIAPMLSRQNNPSLAILLAATIMILINPVIIWYDAGFHLSFLATIGIFYCSGPIQKILDAVPLPTIIKSPLVETTSAQITTMPYLAGTFHQLALFAPITNMLVLPTIPFLMLIGFTSIIATFILPKSIATLFTNSTSIGLEYVFFISKLSNSLPFSTILLNLNKTYLPICYLAIFLIIKLSNRHDTFTNNQP